MLPDSGIAVTDAFDVTRFPEMIAVLVNSDLVDTFRIKLASRANARIAKYDQHGASRLLASKDSRSGEHKTNNVV
jgi:hypothetical protein